MNAHNKLTILRKLDSLDLTIRVLFTEIDTTGVLHESLIDNAIVQLLDLRNEADNG